MPQGAQLIREVMHATGYVANITATAGTALKTTPAKVSRVFVNAASTAAGGLYDCAAVANTAAAKLVFTIPATVGVYTIECPFATGVTVFPGAGMTLAVSLA